MKITKFETNFKRKLYFHQTENIKSKIITNPIENQIIRIYPQITFQKFLGFGGAITDSTGFCLQEVPSKIAEEIIKEYYAKDGLNYTFGRLPIGSCDFSVNSYSYSYQKDLSDFSIKRDLKSIIPAIKMAQKQKKEIKFLASPWSPPSFMKSNHSLYHGGKLLPEYKKSWANYLVKYVQEYQKQGIEISYMTIQNEPNASQIWESCLYTAQEEADLLKNYLFPIFQKNQLKTKFFLWDHNKEQLLDRSYQSLLENGAFDHVEGMAFHWYTGNHFENIALTHQLFPDKLLFHTEGCTGYSAFKEKDELFNAEMYANDILGDLNAGIHGFIDWNLVLDYQGGPNHTKNYCNSLIMLNKNKTNYIKTPAFYYMKHFSHFLEPGSTRIGFTKFSENIQVTAFQISSNRVMIVLFNKTDQETEYNLCFQNNVIHDNLDRHCLVTFLIDGV